MKWLLTILLTSSHLFASTIGIIDTGFDLDHEFLRPRILKNETDEETIDPDLKNKFNGWSFHDNSHIAVPVIQDQDLLSDILKYRKLRAKGQKEGFTPEEYQWYSLKKADKEFRGELKKFKKHIHGTVVASIALREGDNISIFPIRGLDIEVPVVAVENEVEPLAETPKSIVGIKKFEREIKLSKDRVTRKFTKICQYLSLKKVTIVNASYGITYKNIASKFQDMYREYLGEEIPAPLLSQYIDQYFNDIYEKAIKTIRRYPNMLFVFSAGNSGLDNDLFHHYPSRVKLENTITVAATNSDYLASFSNYGKNKVDIGAPGVGIRSIIPRAYSVDGSDVWSSSSGTSMAAPYISNLAAQIQNANPKLKPWQIKKIIVETGDTKEHLLEKLISGSIVNNAKALKAANLSKEISLEHAIQLATLEIVPMQDEISLNFSPAKAYSDSAKKLFESIPVMTPQIDDEDATDSGADEVNVLPATKTTPPTEKKESSSPAEKSTGESHKDIKNDSTKQESSLPTDQAIAPLDNLEQPPSTDSLPLEKETSQDHSNQSEELSQKPSEDLLPSSSQNQPLPQKDQPPETSPSLQQ